MNPKATLFILLTILVIGSCAKANAAPTTPTQAVEVDVASAVNATLTALAPTATRTPAPTATPPATAAPIVIPAGWVEYEAITGEFTLAYPPEWEVSDERPTGVFFDAPDYALFTAGVSNPECDHSTALAGDTAALDCFVTLVAEVFGDQNSFRLIDKGMWDDGMHKGYVVETKTRNDADEQYNYRVNVFIPLQDTLLHASYLRTRTESITDGEREAFTMAVRSIRPKGGEQASANNLATIYARDEQGELLPGGVVNVWDDYETRSKVVAKCQDRETVTILRQAGDGVLIETQAGKRGWVSRWFVRG